MQKIFNEIFQERKKQDDKWGEQNHPIVEENFDSFIDYGIIDEKSAKQYCEDAIKRKNLTWANIIVEEITEALHARTKEEMREELVQCAAVLVAMIESLDRNGR